jgi:hypothetical protein
MARKSLVPHNFSRTAGFKALGCPAVGLHFRHYCPPLLNKVIKEKTAVLSIFTNGKKDKACLVSTALNPKDLYVVFVISEQ